MIVICKSGSDFTGVMLSSLLNKKMRHYKKIIEHPHEHATFFVFFLCCIFFIFVVKISYLKTDFLPQHSIINDNRMILEIIIVGHIEVKSVFRLCIVNKNLFRYHFI